MSDHETHTDATTDNAPMPPASGEYPGSYMLDGHEALQEARLRDLETQVAQLTQRLGVQQQRQQQEMADFMHLLGSTLVQQAQQIHAKIVYPTTIRAVPEEEEDNGGTVFLTLSEGEPALYREENGEFKRFYPAGVDANALKQFIEQRRATDGASMYRVNIYLDR